MGAIAAVLALFAWAAICAEALPLLSQWQLDHSQAAVRRGEFEEARKTAERARSLQPWAVTPKIQLAQALAEGGRADEALFPARDAVRTEPTNWRTWLVLANIENRLGGTADYDRHLRIARSLNPRSSYWQAINFSLPPDQLPR
jgi:Flp pilus assembly protein TadD